jgi:hypothetical protein
VVQQLHIQLVVLEIKFTMVEPLQQQIQETVVLVQVLAAQVLLSFDMPSNERSI